MIASAYNLLRSVVHFLRALRLRYFDDVGYVSRHLHRLHIWMRHFKSIRKRRAIVKGARISPLAQEIAHSLKSKGYYVTSLEKLGASSAVVKYCEELARPVKSFSLLDVAKLRAEKSKTYWLDLLEEQKSEQNPLFDFFTMPILVQAAAKYFGEVPMLSNISLLFTPPQVHQV